MWTPEPTLFAVIANQAGADRAVSLTSTIAKRTPVFTGAVETQDLIHSLVIASQAGQDSDVNSILMIARITPVFTETVKTQVQKHTAVSVI